MLKELGSAAQPKERTLLKLRALQDLIDGLYTIPDVFTLGINGLTDTSKRLGSIAIQSLAEAPNQIRQTFALKVCEVI
ncbi:hypothetical protein D3C78_1522640 [compost metagenome]